MARLGQTKVGLYLDDDLAADLRMIAASTGETMSDVVTRIAGHLIRAEMDVHFARGRNRNKGRTRSLYDGGDQ